MEQGFDMACGTRDITFLSDREIPLFLWTRLCESKTTGVAERTQKRDLFPDVSKHDTVLQKTTQQKIIISVKARLKLGSIKSSSITLLAQ